MPRPSQEKCRLCSKLSTAEAQQKHGSTSDNCWDASRCHDRRSYYRHRGVKNYNRKQQRHLQQQMVLSTEPTVNRNVVTLEIPAPAIPAAIPPCGQRFAIAHWYRETKTSLLHALDAELWIGNNRVAKIAPVHCLGLTEMQIKGGVVWGISMALQEETHLGTRYGQFVNHNLAEYHVPVNADVGNIDAFFVEENDPYVNPLGMKGVGEIGIVGSAAAIANAVYHATGKRIRDLPITPDKLL